MTNQNSHKQFAQFVIKYLEVEAVTTMVAEAVTTMVAEAVTTMVAEIITSVKY